jgi:signal transduction histidine kinase
MRLRSVTSHTAQPYLHAMRFGKRLVTAICLIANLAVPACAFADSPAPTVLIIDESASGSPFGHRFIAQVHSTLDAQATLRYVINAEFLDLGHFNSPAYEALQHAFLRGKYRNTPISVILALGSKALAFAARMRADVWPQVPIVFVTFDHVTSTQLGVPPNTTAIVAARQFGDMVTAAQVLVPKLRTIALVGETLERQPLRDHYQADIRRVAQDLKVIDLTNLPLTEVKKRIATLPADAAIAYLPLYTDETGFSHNPGEALTAVADAANRPIVVDSEDLIGKGATGGFVLSATELGQAAGQRVARILDGEDASSIPPVAGSFIRPEFDARQLKRWNVSEQMLPAGSEVRFRELNVWDAYRWQIIAAAVTIPIQTIIIIWLFLEHRRRIVAEREAHQHLLEVTKMDRAMTVSAMSTSIGHELNQPLSAILNNAETAEILLKSPTPDREQLKEILADIRNDDHRAVEIIKHLRTMLKQGELDPQVIEVAELISDTLKLVRRQAAQHDVTVEVDSVPANLWVRADRVHIQQVLLNLAMNAIDAMENTPAGKRKLKLRIRQQNYDVLVSLEDTGQGIPDDKLKSIFKPFVTTKQQGTGLGLSVARTIVGTYGGKIWAENGPSGGAIFHFTLTLAPAEAA